MKDALLLGVGINSTSCGMQEMIKWSRYEAGTGRQSHRSESTECLKLIPGDTVWHVFLLYASQSWKNTSREESFLGDDRGKDRQHPF